MKQTKSRLGHNTAANLQSYWRKRKTPTRHYPIQYISTRKWIEQEKDLADENSDDNYRDDQFCFGVQVINLIESIR